MTAEIIDGKKIAAQVKSDAAQKAVMYRQLYGRQIGLAVILVGSDPASEIYVRNKKSPASSAISLLLNTICRRKRLKTRLLSLSKK